MERRDINPWEWSKAFGFSQAVEIKGAARILRCAGQTAIGDDGSPPKTDDMGEQVRTALDNLATVLGAADMTFTNIVHMTIYTTDVDGFIGASSADTRLADAGNLPAMTLIGVARLAFPELKVEIEVTAVA
jgi:enamine deaminase RidA (YjgF/YER057c/UK114 family)